jgi:hypothetical protein
VSFEITFFLKHAVCELQKLCQDGKHELSQGHKQLANQHHHHAGHDNGKHNNLSQPEQVGIILNSF